MKDIVLHTPWDMGGQDAIRALADADIEDLFPCMDPSKGFDLICPSGGGKIVCIKDGSRDVEEDTTAIDNGAAQTSTIGCDVEEDLEPDLEDFAGSKLKRLSVNETDLVGNMEMQNSKRQSPWISINGGDIDVAPRSSVKHKASVLWLYSDPLSQRHSLDRLKRVQGYSHYNDNLIATANMDPTFWDPSISIDDPIATILCCRNVCNLAICQVRDILHNGKHMDLIPYTEED